MHLKIEKNQTMMGTCLARCRAKNSTSAELSHPCSPRFNQHLPLDLRADSSVSAKALNVDHSRHRAGATGQGPHERKPSLTKNWAEFAEPQVPSNLHLLHKFRNHKNNQKVDESLVRKSTSRILTKPTKNVVHGNNLSSYFHKSVASVSQTFFWGIIL